MKALLILIICTMGIRATQAQETPAERPLDANFVHSVYFWLHNPDQQEDRAAFEAALSTFLSKSKYAKTNFIGVAPKATREVVDGSFTYNLIVSFESAEAQDNYQTEQAHLDFIEEAKHLWSKVIVYDATGIAE